MEALRRRRFLKIYDYDDDDNNYDELETKKTRIEEYNWKNCCLPKMQTMEKEREGEIGFKTGLKC